MWRFHNVAWNHVLRDAHKPSLMLMLRFYKNRLGMFTAYYGFLLTMAIEILVFKWRLYPWVIPPSFLHSAATFTPPQPCLCKSP
ncbi:hypothetical protein JHK82_023226 [Glycine max]|uniref:Uncharacterized protein n=2 Tax=Glycine subgen. Soja TaxID=1462606 RepID=A0A0R0IW43_SOYBN|nr:hypothetical protein JHK87_023167 [Glycine soja]KAG5017626.1 hypothetical protein JHK85_023762 [Glycine max]KAG5027376.1 hypothetical protein JHK86_023290 [Glycine max]KAG5138495.1 hypothetical protein JHK82_023226 [Glycine max]KAH1054264.1 hypothetical protein GYH30_023167 [Glycine max]